MVDDGREQWSVSIVLSDGDTAFVRPMTPQDAPALLAFHERQPRENLYLRFFSAKPSLSAKELEHFTVVDFRDRVALVMEHRGQFIAWASYERWQGRDDADVAFMVDQEQRGRGIATLLLEHLAAIARANGIHRFTAEVLYENKPMLRVFARAGWPVQRHFDSGVTALEFPLGDTDAFIDSVEAREHRADSSAVARLLLPRTIAVIGASDTVGTAGNELWRNVSRRFAGPTYAVNPNHAEVGGQRAYASVGDIDDDVSLAIVAVPAAELRATIESCIAKRVRGAIVVTAVDGFDLDVPALVEHARRNGLRIIGPASMGVASPDGVGALQAALVDVDLPAGGVAISMQSGSLGASLLQRAGQLRMGVSWFVSLGDKSDVSGNDLLQFWEDDENTTVIAMYTETFGNPRKFARIARRVGRRKPIVAVRTGAAALGSGSDAMYQQAGLIEVPTVPALLDTVRVLTTQPMLHGPHVAVLTNARSPGVLATAALHTAGLQVVNPPRRLDWRSSAADFGAAITAALADDGVDGILVIHAPPIVTPIGPEVEIDLAALHATKPVVAVMLGREDGPVREGSRVPAFSFPEPAAGVLGRMFAHSTWLAGETESEVSDEPLGGLDAAAAALLIGAALDRDDSILTRDDVAELMRCYGVPLAPARSCPSADTAGVLAAAHELGYPVAVKSTNRRIGRSAQAGIALDLANDQAVSDALRIIRTSLGAAADDVVVQRMVQPGVDARVHCAADPPLGTVITLDLGSQQGGLAGDGASRLTPVSEAGARSLLRASRVGAALAAAEIDDEPLVELLVRVSHLVADHPTITEVDLNPIIVSGRGCWVTDAHVEVRPLTSPGRALRSLG